VSGLGSYEAPVRSADLYRWQVAIAAADLLSREDAARGRDEGTCVLGAGVAIWTLPPRARNPKRAILVHAPFQGNVGSQKACRRALAVIREAGLEGAVWYDGVMD